MTTISANNVTKPDSSNVLDISDIAGLLQIIDLASKRGAFAGAELGKIGALYDKVSNVIKKHDKPDQTI